MASRLWVLAVLLGAAGCARGEEQGAGLTVAFVRPAQPSINEESIQVIFRHGRSLAALTNAENELVVIVTLRSGDVVYGRSRVALVPNADVLHVTIPTRNLPLPLSGLSGVVYVTPVQDTSWGARVHEARFTVDVVDNSVTMTSILPRQLTTQSRELLVNVQYIATTITGQPLVLVVMLKDATSKKVALETVPIVADRGTVTVRVRVKPEVVLAAGGNRLSAHITPVADLSWAASLCRTAATVNVLTPTQSIAIVSVQPELVHPATSLLEVRASVSAFSAVGGETVDPHAEGDLLIIVTLQDAAGSELGSGTAVVHTDARYVLVSATISNALPLGEIRVLGHLVRRENAVPSAALATAVGRTISVIQDPGTFLTFEGVVPATLAEDDTSITVTISYSIGGAFPADTEYSIVAMVSGEAKKYGRQQHVITAAQGTVTLQMDIASVAALEKSLTPLKILAFIAPTDSPRFSDAVAKSRLSLPRHQQRQLEVLGAVVYSQKGTPYLSARVRYALVNLDPAVTSVTITAFAQIDGEMLGKTSIASSSTASGLADFEIELEFEPPAGASMKVVVLVGPGSDRAFASHILRGDFDIGTDFPRYDPQEHRVAITSTLQQSMYVEDQFVVAHVDYSVAGLGPLLPNGLADLVPGSWSLKVIAQQGTPAAVLGSTEFSPTALSGTIPITIEFVKAHVLGPIQLRVRLETGPELSAKFNSTVGNGLERHLVTYHDLMIEPHSKSYVQVMRTIPTTLAANLATFTVDIMYNVTDGCPGEAEGAVQACVVRVKAVQNGVLVGLTDHTVHQRRTSMETVTIVLKHALEVGADVRIRTKVIRLDANKLTVAVGPLCLVPVTNIGLPCAADQPQQTRKNILFLMVDDLGTQVGAYGDKTALTPNINAIAAKGIRFDSQFVDQPTCIPARAAMLTGVRTARTGQLFGTHTFRKHKGIQSAAEIFIKAGYATYTFGKVFHFRTEYLGTTAGFNGNRRVKYIDPASNLLDQGPLSEFADASPLAYTDGQVAREAIAVIEEHKRTRQPFWLAVGFNKPHVPFAAPKAYKELFAAVEFPPTGDDMPLNVDRTGPAHNKWGDVKKFEPLVSMNAFTDIMPQSVKDSISMGYKATTTFSDEMLGRVVNALGCLANDTHIFVWGDQGWHLGEQGLWGKNSMFDAVLQSPLIISPAGHVGELVQSTVVESVDILPTMMAMVGIERGDAMLDGRSLVSLFNENSEDRIAYSIGARGRYMAYSIRTSRYRYTEWIDLNASPKMFANLNLTALPDMHITTLLATGAATRTEWTELYDFAQGPTEVENIVGTASARIVEELAELLRIKTHGPRTQW